MRYFMEIGLHRYTHKVEITEYEYSERRDMVNRLRKTGTNVSTTQGTITLRPDNIAFVDFKKEGE